MLFIGISSFIAYWCLLFYVFKKWGLDNSKTISDHVATGDQRKFYNLKAIFLISLFMSYVVFYLISLYDLGAFVYLLAIIAWVLVLLVIYFPRHGRYFNLHDKLNRIAGSSVYMLTLLVGLSSQASTKVHIFTLVSLFLIAVDLIPIISLERRKNYILFQSVYFGGLQIVLLVLGILK